MASSFAAPFGFRHSPLSLFIAGFLATMIFHQAVAGVWYLTGVVPNPPFNFHPTAPFGVPKIWSLALWGGAWGVVFGWVEAKVPDGLKFWVAAILIGAIVPTLFGRIVIAPIRHVPINLALTSLYRGFEINGAWGLGVAAFLRWRA